MYSTQVSLHVNAPPSAVYQALLDAEAIAKWRVPDGMTSHVHEFEAREGGSFRISLTYDAPDRTGKSTSHTDTYHGYFARLVPDEQVVEVFEFETADPALDGTMTMTTTLTDADGGTDVLIVHEGIPDIVPAADRDAYLKLADDLEGFLAQLRGNAATATVEDRQRVLRLLVKDILIGPEKITIRHRVPARPGSSGARQHDPGPDTEGDHRRDYLLRCGRGFAAARQRVPALRPGPAVRLVEAPVRAR